jgi:hypothetical protein
MRKHLLTLGMLLLLISITGAYNIHQARNTQSFRCRLEGIRCDACRVGIEEELSEQSGIRSVQFEGEDRKDLLVLHSTNHPATAPAPRPNAAASSVEKNPTWKTVSGLAEFDSVPARRNAPP